MVRRLSDDELLAAIEVAPLVSIDLLVTDPDGRLLVGERVNDPAKGSWFVPGGQIKKDDRDLGAALARIGFSELGIPDLFWRDENLVGVFTHQYDTNFKEAAGISTHYVVLAYRLDDISAKLDFVKFSNQHSQASWVDPEDDADPLRPQIHPNTTAYFKFLNPLMTHEQYVVANHRRDAFNALVWQTPIVGLTGLAFIYTVLLAGGTAGVARWIAALLAVVIAVAVIQLTAKQRFGEETLANETERFETAYRLNRLNRHRRPESRFTAYSSVKVWHCLFALAAIGAVLAAVVLTWPTHHNRAPAWRSPVPARYGGTLGKPLPLEHLVVDPAQPGGHLVGDAAGDDQQVDLARRAARVFSAGQAPSRA